MLELITLVTPGNRNDWALSGQVVKAASKVVQLGVGLAHFKVSNLAEGGVGTLWGLVLIDRVSG